MEKVTISGYHLAQNQEGEQFVVLSLMGGVELIQSSISGKFYATAKKTRVTSTFAPEIAQQLIGTQIPGKIERVNCEPYTYVIQQTGEEVTLSHRYDYMPNTIDTGKQLSNTEKEAFQLS